MILYFSGTGNSRYISEVINSVVDDQLISMNSYLKNNAPGNFNSVKPYIFVCPTYAWQIPRVVEGFINSSSFNGNKKAYFILTCGLGIGNAGKYVEKLLKDNNLEYMGVAKVVMPENFITMFNAPSANEAKMIINRAIRAALEIAEMIKMESELEKVNSWIGGIVASSIINKLFYPLFVKDKGFYVNDRCTGCKKCQYLCPLNNIKIVENKPHWNNHCTQCMACIGGCPFQVIEYKNKTQGKRRYYLKESYRR